MDLVAHAPRSSEDRGYPTIATAGVDFGKIASDNGGMVRRKPGTLLPLEVDILTAAVEAQRRGEPRFHGFELAKALADGAVMRSLTSHGTLYKALGRLEDRGLLASRWEDPAIAADEGRPRRRLYEVTGAGERALAAWHVQQAAGAPGRRPGLAGT